MVVEGLGRGRREAVVVVKELCWLGAVVVVVGD